MNKDELLQQITSYYLDSHDFNGCPSYALVDYAVDDLVSLIENAQVRILSDSDDINTFINRSLVIQSPSLL